MVQWRAPNMIIAAWCVVACAAAYTPPQECVQHDTEDVTIHLPAGCDFDSTVHSFCNVNKVLNNTCDQIKTALESQAVAADEVGLARDVPLKLIHGTQQDIDLWGNVKVIFFKPSDDPKEVANELCRANSLNEGVCKDLREGVVQKYRELWCSSATPPESRVQVQGGW
jgi:hypothetical protein